MNHLPGRLLTSHVSFLLDELIFHRTFDDVKALPSRVNISRCPMKEEDGVKNSDETVERLCVVWNQLQDSVLRREIGQKKINGQKAGYSEELPPPP